MRKYQLHPQLNSIRHTYPGTLNFDYRYYKKEYKMGDTSGNCKCLTIVFVVVGIVIISIALLASSLKKLESYEVGVQYDKVGRKLGDGIDYAGLHTGPPGFEFMKFPSVFKTIHFPSLKCFTYDGAKVYLNVQYQYKAVMNEVPRIIRLFRNHEKFLEMLTLAGMSTIHLSCSRFTAKDIIDERVAFANSTNHMLIERYKNEMAEIHGLQINNIARPTPYNDAQKDKETVRENIQIKIKERPEKLTNAQILVEKATADAKIKLQDAQRDARTIITRATAEAEAIQKQAEVEAGVYIHIIESGFIGDALINYIGVDMLASSKKPVQISVPAPAKLP